MGYTQLLMSGALQGDHITHAYQAIQRNAQAQARLVESLLDLSRVLAGKLELNSEVWTSHPSWRWPLRRSGRKP